MLPVANGKGRTNLVSPLVTQAQDFSRWYQDVLAQASLAENGPVRGTIVIRPYAYRIWELMQADLDRRIKDAGAQNCYMPLFIPSRLFDLEGEHVDGFRPELAAVTYGGGEELAEPIIVRPTSELLFGQSMSRWIHSYRDLPLLLNQWANVVRWELRPRLFIRTTEFLWQEGHTAHATEAEAADYARNILQSIYRDFMINVMCVPIIAGRKSPAERFPGALNSMTCEGIMRDGKALQMGTSHELGQTFSRMCNITFSDQKGVQQYCWTASWGVSTRLIGGLIMTHGDDKGLNLPPPLAPIQVVVVGVREGPGVTELALRLENELRLLGIRTSSDLRWEQSFGRRVTDWEIKGVPIRFEIGPAEAETNSVVIVERQTGVRIPMSADLAVAGILDRLKEVTRALLIRAESMRDGFISDVASVDDAIAVGRTGVARIPWTAISSADRTDQLKVEHLSVRCLQTADGELPSTDDDPDAMAFISRAY
jgi:prolyl-tRNA synthetase